MDLINYIFLYFAIDRKFIQGMYGIKSKIQYMYLITLSSRKELNPRYTINLKYLHQKMGLKKQRSLFEKYKYFLYNSHPFIDFTYIEKEIDIYSFRIYKIIEEKIKRDLVFPSDKYIETDFSLTHETGPLTILDCIHLAGNVLVQEGRELFPTRRFK
jgi:hypothetical protein